MRHLVIGTAGHIDHGKSALVLALTGTDPDRLKEEKARGITIDLGFAHWEAPGLTVAFVDVPGHERFVKNMLAGAGGLDAVMLVVAADESVMPQTREHFEICRLLGVPAGVVAVTKADLADRDLVELVTLEVRELVRGSFLEDAPIIGVSSRTGEGLDQLRAALVGVAERVPSRSADGAVRLPVDRVFSVKGFGTVVTGTLTSGRLDTDADLEILPGGRRAKVRGLQVHGQSQQAAEAGQRVAVNLTGVDVPDLQRGVTLVTPGALEATRVCDVRIELLASAKPLRHGARVRFHQGTAEVLGRVALSGPAPLPDALESSPVEVAPGRSAYARLRFESPVVVTRSDRFILRAYSPPVTVAGGAVIDPAPPRGAIRTAAGRQRFVELDPVARGGPGGGDDALAVAAFVIAETGQRGLPVSALVSRLGLTPGAANDVQAGLEARGLAVRVGGVLVAPSVIARTSAAILALVRAHHEACSLEEGMAREELRERTCGRAADGLFERVLADLVAGGHLVARDRVALASHQLSLAPDEERARDGLDALYRKAGLRPPDLREAAVALGQRSEVVERMAALLVRQKVLVRIETLLFHAEALAALKADLATMKAASGAGVVIDVPRFKDRFGVSRKFAIPLLEYLDRERVTRRVGDSRVLV